MDITGFPGKIKDALLSIEADNFESMVSSAQLVPAPVSSTFAAINGKKHKIVGRSDWTLNLTFAQDYETVGSLSNKLLLGEGDIVDAVFTPVAGGIGFAVSITLSAASIGGDADADAVSSVSLGVNGIPTPVPAV